MAGLLPFLEIQAFIAQGGMGAVYKGRQRSLDRAVAVKVLPRELGADPMFHESFETEAKAMARLNHPNLIGVYDFGTVEGMPYIVMEYVHGKSLFHSALNKRIEPREAVRIAVGICRGLAHAHENGVIHRDIKPANILLTPKAEPKIGDFGLARPAESDGPGLMMGTPGYTAPEILRDPEQADARADLYAVGVILHELLTGQPPGTSAGQPPPTGNLRLDALWRKATQDDPARRYASAAEMADALEGWLRTAGPVMAGPPPAVPAAGAVSGVRKPLQGKQRAGAGAHHSLIRNLLIIAALLIAIGITAQVYDRKKQSIEERRVLSEREMEEKRDAAVTKPVKQVAAVVGQTGAEEEAVGGGGFSEEPLAEVPVRDAEAVEPGGPAAEVVAVHEDEDEEEESAEDAAAGIEALGELRAMARQVLGQAIRERDEKLAANAKSFAWDLDFSLRGLTNRDRDLWLPHVAALKGMVRNHRVPTPEDFGESSTVRLSDPMAKVCTFYYGKQREIDDGHQARMGLIRDAYMVRLQDAVDEARQQGRDAQEMRLREAARAVADMEAWVDGLTRE